MEFLKFPNDPSSELPIRNQESKVLSKYLLINM